MAKIELVNVAHSYTPGIYAVKGVNLTWENGVSSALLGPSGCGKTTLLKIISGLLKPSEGKVLLNGQDVTDLPAQKRSVAQVFQFPVVYETLSVFDNLAFPLRNQKVSKSRVKTRVHEMAELLDLKDILQKNASRLGAAEKQLISLGRGIVREDITVLLLDEPLTVIDPQLKWRLRRKLKELHQKLGFTMIYVTHDQHEALTFADQVTVMNAGMILQTGSPQELHHYPQDPFVGYFIGSPGMNVFPVVVQDSELKVGGYSLPVSIEAWRNLSGRAHKLGIRPEFIETSLTQRSGWLNCTVRTVTMTSNAQIVDLHGAGLNFKARLDENTNINEGGEVWVNFPKDRLMLYANDKAIRLDEEEIV